MKDLRTYLSNLNVKENSEERIIYQVMDLQMIKFKAVQLGDIFPGDIVYQAIDKTIEGFLWLYSKGLSFESSVKEKLDGQELAYYEEFGKAFSTFNEYMRTHMHLTE